MNDQAARDQAIDPTSSFIVQAPAGSGKTEILTQRFLKLLSYVNEPEEIVAITFTRKAAAEMRHRIISSLVIADTEEPPTIQHKCKTYNLAKSALENSKQRKWNIINNPNRLRILTIDALSGFLSSHIPILAELGAQPEINTDASPLYEDAVRQCMITLAEDKNWHAALETILLHFDNQLPRVIDLLCQILSKREQWLPHIIKYQNNLEILHEHLNKSLYNVVQDSIYNLVNNLDSETLQLLIKLHNFAATQLNKTCIPANIETNPDTLSHWQSLANLVLTQADNWRKRITVKEGFAAKSTEKTQLIGIIEQLQSQDMLEFFIALRHSPPLTYSNKQSQMVDSLVKLLPMLCAQLSLTFQEHNCVDFVEINLAACRALGTEDEPTDLALYLDHQIQHLLIDEFQDTSVTQYTLIQKLVSGWEPDDGRTLFLVGDPMQSIYRFRDAEVGLFLRAEQYGIQQCHLKKLTLERNFRSDKIIVDWVNNNFKTIFPTHPDMNEGAVPYSSSEATQSLDNSSIQTYTLVDGTPDSEAEQILTTIKAIQAKAPKQTIAILVRSRLQLPAIISKLLAAKINYQGVDLSSLTESSAVKDLITLTRALLHRQDRIAWLALLRSPIIGFTTQDLLLISQNKNESSIWKRLTNLTLQINLSEHAKTRVEHLTNILNLYFAEAGIKPFDIALKGVWQALGFSDIYDQNEIANAEKFFTILAQCLSNSAHPDIEQLYNTLNTSFTDPVRQASNILIMTIHKAKGLEFDHVILPGLNKGTNKQDQAIMHWLERPNLDGNIDFILAPIKPSSHEKDSIYSYLQRNEQCKLQYESARLLYVAATRAKRGLYLYACINKSKKENINFNKNTFANMLAAPLLENIIYIDNASKVETDLVAANPQRTPLKWQPQIVIAKDIKQLPDNPLPEYEDVFKRHLGTVIHLWLADQQRESWNIQRWKQHLLMLNIPRQQLPQAFDIIQLVQENIKNDPRAQWILDPSHSESQFEYAITTYTKGFAKQLIIDRTFIDDGIRWVIDYKTATPIGDIEQFVQKEWELYQSQLQQYKQALKSIDDTPIKTALYFPVFKGWIEEI